MLRPRTGSPCPLGLCQSIPEHGAGSHPSPDLSQCSPGAWFKAWFSTMPSKRQGTRSHTKYSSSWHLTWKYERCGANLCYFWYSALIITLWMNVENPNAFFFWMGLKSECPECKRKGWTPFLWGALIMQKSTSDLVREKARNCMSTSY